ncbi:hypothetical protein [Verrucomicrobium spinosum]|uniref:hypothetical protein n=1 Tax=Verrucomicrobium spinosum TaxID=2736 RepID=UPI00210EF192|nr:hypothetical protein [Verrucomicrobium spinosum]
MSDASPSTLPPVTWMDGLAEFLANEHGVEAILLHPEQRKVSLATLGTVDTAALTDRLNEVLRELDAQWSAHGEPNGTLPPGRSFSLQVRHLPDDAVLIEKPSCPTAPRFWKWREFSWPEPDELEDHSREEWQALAWQAGICGVALVAGWTLEHTGVPRLSGSLVISCRSWPVAGTPPRMPPAKSSRGSSTSISSCWPWPWGPWRLVPGMRGHCCSSCSPFLAHWSTTRCIARTGRSTR